MTLVAGASRYLTQSTLTNQQGFSAQSSNLLGVAAGATGILDIGRNLEVQGVGISARARNLNRQFLESTSGTYNQLFSASGGGSSSVEAAQIQIRALSSSTPTSRNTPETREALADIDNARGSIVDEEI